MSDWYFVAQDLACILAIADPEWLARRAAQRRANGDTEAAAMMERELAFIRESHRTSFHEAMEQMMDDAEVTANQGRKEAA